MRERILTSEQVARILQVHPFTVLKYIKEGKLKGSKLGRMYRIRESDVESFLNKQIHDTPFPKNPPQKESVSPPESQPVVEVPAANTAEVDKNYLLE